LDLPAIPLLEPREFDSCPGLSPAEGFNASDPRLNYVNSFLATSVAYGLSPLATKIFGQAPDLVLAGPNVGSNLGLVTVQASGTVGAACKGSRSGIPSIAFSGTTGDQTSYTTLPNAWSGVYATLATEFVQTLISNANAPYLPADVILNINFPALNGTCAQASDVKFLLTRLTSFTIFDGADVTTCRSSRLPAEEDVVDAGCFASVSVLDNETKLTADATAQGQVLAALESIFTCFSSS